MFVSISPKGQVVDRFVMEKIIDITIPEDVHRWRT
jgi:hypothetical protein